MICLCCGKEIKESASVYEKAVHWHKSCIRRFFGTERLPEIDLTERQLDRLVDNAVNQRLTVTGVQKKLSLHLSREKNARLTIVDYPTGYILKPQTDEYESVPEYEHLSMLMAQTAGIRTVQHALISLKDQYAYITRRVDRVIDGEKIQRIAMEDFCQLNRRQTIDKYKGSYEMCAKTIRKYSVHSGLDISEFFIRIIFSFLIGNSDMHLKNFSLREREPGNRQFVLSEAYDMLPVNLVLPEDRDQTALTLNGKRRNLHRGDYLKFAAAIGIPGKAAANMIDRTISHEPEYLMQIDAALLRDDQKDAFKELVSGRCRMLRP